MDRRQLRFGTESSSGRANSIQVARIQCPAKRAVWSDYLAWVGHFRIDMPLYLLILLQIEKFFDLFRACSSSSYSWGRDDEDFFARRRQ